MRVTKRGSEGRATSMESVKRPTLRPDTGKSFSLAIGREEMKQRRKQRSQSPKTASQTRIERTASDHSSVPGLVQSNITKHKLLSSLKSNPRYAELLFKKMQFPEALTELETKHSFILQNLNSPQQEFRLPQNAQHLRDYFATTPQGLTYWTDQLQNQEHRSKRGGGAGGTSHFSSLESDVSQLQLSSVSQSSPRRSTFRVQSAYSTSQVGGTQTFQKPPRTAGPSALQSVILPSVIPERRKAKNAKKQLVKIPRELPLSSSPLRNSYEITRDTLMTNLFKHTSFSPAMLTNHQKKVLEGVLDPENPVLSSARGNTSRASSAHSFGPKRSVSPLRATVAAAMGGKDNLPRRPKKQKNAAVEAAQKKHKRAESVPTKQEIMADLNEQALADPEGMSLNEMIVKHGEFVKKHSPYAKPRALIFTPERPPLLKKQPTVSQDAKSSQFQMDRLIASQFSQNQDNTNLRQLYNSKAPSIKDFISSRLRKFQPPTMTTRPGVRVAKELKGDGKQMNKVPPRMRGVLDPTPKQPSPSQQGASPQPETKTPVDMRKLEKYLRKTVAAPKNVVALAEQAPIKSAAQANLPILFEERHEPSEQDSIFNISMESKQGKMSLRRYNIEKRKEKMQREARQRKAQEERRAFLDQHKRRLIEDTLDKGAHRRSFISSKKTSEPTDLAPQLIDSTPPIISPLPVTVEVRKRIKEKKNPIQDLMGLIQAKSKQGSPKVLKDVLK